MWGQIGFWVHGSVHLNTLSALDMSDYALDWEFSTFFICAPLELFAYLQAIICTPLFQNLHTQEILAYPRWLKYPSLKNPALDHSAIWASNLTISMTRCLISLRHNCHKSWSLSKPCDTKK